MSAAWNSTLAIRLRAAFPSPAAHPGVAFADATVRTSRLVSVKLPRPQTVETRSFRSRASIPRISPEAVHVAVHCTKSSGLIESTS